MAAEEGISFEGAGERYKFLLQPVKDLTASWDIDIVQHLVDYVRKVVEESQITVVDENGRRKVFNFAEAALLIHGTTNIYSKKVEYVYKLALTFFDQLKEEPPKKRRKDGDPNDGEEPGEDGGDAGEDDGGQRQRAAQKKQRPNLSIMKGLLEKLSRPKKTLPMIPIAFIPFSDFEKTNVPLCSRTNPTEVIGKKDDFKINSCHIYESTALLDLQNIALINKFSDEVVPFVERPNVDRPRTSMSNQENLEPRESELLPDNVRCGSSLNVARTTGPDHDLLSNLNTQLEPLTEKSELANDTLQQLEDQNNVANKTMNRTVASIMDWADNFEPFDDAFEPVEPEQQQQEQPPEAEQNDENTAPPAARRRSATEVPENWEEEFAELNPNELKNEKSRPFKMDIKCCTQAEKQVKTRNKRFERECAAKGLSTMQTVKAYTDQRMYRRKLKRRMYAFAQFNSFLVDQAVLSLNPFIYEEEKRRMEIKRARQRERQEAARAERASRRQTATLDPVLDNPEEQGPPPPADDFDDFGGDQYEDATEELVAEEIINQNEPENDDLEIHDEQLGDLLNVDDLDNTLGIQNLYNNFDNLDRFHGRGKRSRGFSSISFHARNVYDDTIFPEGDNPDDINLPPRPVSQMEYDEIIAFYLRKYWAANESKSSRFNERLQKWEEKINPILEEEQMRRDFDTCVYSDDVLKRFPDGIGSEIDFANLFDDDTENYELSRYLLVSLIMTNMGNVELSGGVNPEDALKVKLLKFSNC